MRSFGCGVSSKTANFLLQRSSSSTRGSADAIWFASGNYIGNFNFASAEAADLILRPEPGVDATQVTIDGAGKGRSMNLSCTAAANITVSNLTFVRKCGNTAKAALRVSTMGADVTVAGCRLLGTTNHQGMGIEIVSARNASVRNCTVTRTNSAVGQGISIAGVSAEPVDGRAAAKPDPKDLHGVCSRG